MSAISATSSLPPDTVAYVTEYEEKRSRLTTFFRMFTALPHYIWLSIYAIAASIAVFIAWFAIVFTGRYPEGLYTFVANYNRYATFVYSYMYLVTDKFPPFLAPPGTPYEAQFLVGPPKPKYSRAKTFFRLLLLIPFMIVNYGFTIIFEIGAFIAWFAIVFTGKQPKGIQDFTVLGLSYQIRLLAYTTLLTEDWPKFTDQAVADDLAARGVLLTAGVTAPDPAAFAAPSEQVPPPPPPAPPAPPAPGA